MANRKRVIYQSEALFVGPSPADSYHFTVNGTGVSGSDVVEAGGEFDGETLTNEIKQIHRVQSTTYSFNIDYVDVNEFSRLAAIDRVVLESPTVNLDFTYLLTDGSNESNLGLTVTPISGTQTSAISGLLNGTSDEKNYFILTTPEGTSAYQNTDRENHTVIGVGNGFISDYSFEAAVGGFPTATVTVEALNMNAVLSSEDEPIPAIDPETGNPVTGKYYSTPVATSGMDETALQPGDIQLTLANSFGATVEGSGSAQIQNVSVSVPITREPLQRLGSRFAFSREITFPVTVTMNVSANVSELAEGNLADLLCEGSEHDLSVTLRTPGCEEAQKEDAMKFELKKAKLDSQSFNASIGPNKTVDLTWSSQIGSPQETERGFFIEAKSAS